MAEDLIHRRYLQRKVAQAQVRGATDDQLIQFAQSSHGGTPHERAVVLELARRLDHHRKAFALIRAIDLGDDSLETDDKIIKACLDARNYLETNIS